MPTVPVKVYQQIRFTSINIYCTCLNDNNIKLLLHYTWQNIIPTIKCSGGNVVIWAWLTIIKGKVNSPVCQTIIQNKSLRVSVSLLKLCIVL
uniref:Uncharacterized protein n=1 Tax=Astyanax mexicanus TaxID=7994 RepID=A0A3B1JX04_ASTMX